MRLPATGAAAFVLAFASLSSAQSSAPTPFASPYSPSAAQSSAPTPFASPYSLMSGAATNPAASSGLVPAAMEADEPVIKPMPAAPAPAPAANATGACNTSGSCGTCNSCVSSCCGAPSCNWNGCDSCEGSRFWISADYLIWWIKDPNLPPLVTQSPAGVPFGTATVLGQPGTSVVFGNGPLDTGTFSGVRLTAGFWISEPDRVGIEASIFRLEKGSEFFSDTSSGTGGSPSIGRPRFNVLTGAEGSSMVATATPFALNGTVAAAYSTQFWGSGVDLVLGGADSPNWRFSATTGFRYMDLAEHLNITQKSFLDGPGGFLFAGGAVVLPPDGLTITDFFDTRNQFYGGSIGFRGGFDLGNLTLDANTKVSIGGTHEVVNIQGNTQHINAAGAVLGTTTGGLLALSSNIGRQTGTSFGFIPEVELKLGYKLTQRLTAFVAYDFLYWNQVVRPGDQIDRVVNPTLLPSSFAFGAAAGPARPAPLFNETDFWAQGITFGLSWKY